MLIATTSTFLGSLEHILGFLIVVFVLCLLWMLTSLVGTLFNRPAPAAIKAPQAGAAAPVGDDPSEEEVAAIAACVTTLMGRRSRVVSIRSSAVDWSREGRREHFASHRIR